jgi:hypothetical protein
MVEQPSPCNIETIVKQTWTHMATNVNVIPQVLQSPRIFQGDLNQKLMDGIISHDFMDQPCNCNHASKPTMENAEKCVLYTKRLARYATSPTLDKHNRNYSIKWASILTTSKS